VNNRMKTYKSLLLIALFVISTIAVVPVIASTGHPTLGVTDAGFTTLYPSTLNVAVRAGDQLAYSMDGLTPPVSPAYFVIDFAGVSFSGAQFSLYISTSGLSQLNSSDTAYTQLFNTADFNSGSPGTFTEYQFTGSVWANGTSPTFWIGTLGTDPVVIGPVPFYVPGGDYWIKVYDGSTTFVAVSAQQVTILPNISVLPNDPDAPVPAGYPMTVVGAGWPAIGQVNITVWHEDDTLATSHRLTPNADGTFTWTFPMPDEGKYFGDTSPEALYNPHVEAFNTTATLLYNSPSDPSMDILQDIFYIGRAYLYFNSVDYAENPVQEIGPGTYGSGVVDLHGQVLGTITVDGEYFFSSGTVNAFADWGTAGQVALPLTFTYAVDDMGFFNATFAVPDLSMGDHLISFVDNSWSWNFTLTVETTIVVTPSEGTISNPATPVTVTGYGFSNNAAVTIYWFGIVDTFRFAPGDPISDYLLLNPAMNTTAGGGFTFSFTPLDMIGETFGGYHWIYANDSNDVYAMTTFFIDQSYVLSTTSAAVGTNVTVIGEGLGTGEYHASDFSEFPGLGGIDDEGPVQLQFGTYWSEPAIVYDNIPTLQGSFQLFSPIRKGFDNPNATGQWTGWFMAAGVPMIHIVQVFDVSGSYWQDYIGTYTDTAQLIASFQLTVTGSTLEGAQIITALTGLSGSVSSLQSSLSSLASSVSSLTTTVNAIQSALNALSTSQASSFSSLNTAVAGVSTAVGNLQTSMNSGFTGVNSAITSLGSSVTSGFSTLTTAVNGVQTTLGGKIDSVSSTVTSLQSALTTLSGNVNTLSGKVDTISSSIGNVKTSTDTLGTITTLLYIAVILALIAVVLEVVVLIRKK